MHVRPPGVPVTMTSPGVRVMIVERNRTSATGPKTGCSPRGPRAQGRAALEGQRRSLPPGRPTTGWPHSLSERERAGVSRSSISSGPNSKNGDSWLRATRLMVLTVQRQPLEGMPDLPIPPRFGTSAAVVVGGHLHGVAPLHGLGVLVCRHLVAIRVGRCAARVRPHPPGDGAPTRQPLPPPRPLPRPAGGPPSRPRPGPSF